MKQNGQNSLSDFVQVDPSDGAWYPSSNSLLFLDGWILGDV